MIYRFEEFSFDTQRCELRNRGTLVPLEPQVYQLLRFLIENRDRMVTRCEIIEEVWSGRFISDTAVSSRIKSARRALGDDGQAQRLIRTLPRLGFRFVGEVAATPAVSVAAEALAGQPAVTAETIDRPSIAVLPFAVMGSASAEASALADALPYDLISQLSRLRWLFVIARGSCSRFRGERAKPAKVRAALGVRYVLTGAIEVAGGRLAVTAELVDARDDGVVWSDRFAERLDAVHEIRERIAAAVLTALELHIPAHEARRARLTSPENLDAWQAYHLGLSHLFRFSREDNAKAAHLFGQAIARQPGFARAHAGLSFTYFEDAFLNFAPDTPGAARNAMRLAEQSLEQDGLDPFCNLVMGRAFWLTGELETGLLWLERSISLNPNSAQGRYARAWTEAMLGDGGNGRAGADCALALSPLDPLAYGFRGVRAFSHLMLDERDAAARWAEQAARSPGAHALIELIAAATQALNGDEARARAWAQSARRRAPNLSVEEFFTAFPMRRNDVRGRIAAALESL